MLTHITSVALIYDFYLAMIVIILCITDTYQVIHVGGFKILSKND